MDYANIPSSDTDDFLKDINNIIAALAKKGLDRVIVVDLTREEIGIPVVRVIVPGSKSLQWTPNAGASG